MSPTFKLALAPLTVTVAADQPSFWKAVHTEGMPGLHVYSVREKDGVFRVATSFVPAGHTPEWMQEVSFWKRTGTTFNRVSYEPYFTHRHGVHANARRAGDPPEKTIALTDTERLQWLMMRLELVELCGDDSLENGRSSSSLERGLGAENFDATYLPALRAQLKSPSIAFRHAAGAQLLRLGETLPFETLIDLLAFKNRDTSVIVQALEPLLVGGRRATPDELVAMTKELRREERVQAEIFRDEFAVRTISSLSRGSRSLLRKTDAGWVELASLGGWVQ